MNRPVIIGILGAVIVLVAIAITFFIDRAPDTARTVAAPPSSSAGERAETAQSDRGPQPVAQRPELEKSDLAAPPITDEPIRPKFDVVRINPRGDTVIAGRAEPNSEVTVSDGVREIGKVKADSRGEWVLVPKKSLKSGAHELTLMSRKKPQSKSDAAPAGIPSKEMVILVVPERGKDIAGRKVDRPSRPLAMAVARDGSGGVTVLQKPGAPVSRATAVPKPRVVMRTPEELQRLASEAAPRGIGAAPGAQSPVVVATGPGQTVATVTQPSELASEAASSGTGGGEPGAQSPADVATGPGQTVAIVTQPSELASEAASSGAAGAEPGAESPFVVATRSDGTVRVLTRRSKKDKARSALSLDVIDYDEKGNLALSGSAPSGSKVHVYVDNKLLGGAKTSEAGEWTLTPKKPVPPGLYRMRVDQVTPSGKVVARVETPFMRAKPLDSLPGGVVVFVQPGNSLWRIARRTYGRGVRYAVIYEANRDQIRNADLIYPGQIFTLPKVN